MGGFKEKKKYCRAKCKRMWLSHEEKESDVNIAIHLLHQAHIDGFDKAQIITADSDLCPAIRLVARYFPEKEIDVLIPPSRYDISRELRGLTKAYKIRQKHLKLNLLPEKILAHTGELIAERPTKYNP